MAALPNITRAPHALFAIIITAAVIESAQVTK